MDSLRRQGRRRIDNFATDPVAAGLRQWRIELVLGWFEVITRTIRAIGKQDDS